ncbi:sialate O-acetylesterase [Mesonia sp.]|uniref:sialate O-acetylesterase n=1 Tax=Mesonia sp. TaxID=1960830 RepID=UPI0017544B78|nr:sialate O-acetylesterase [Mesonia sp.]HIB38536.1 sialate O-acetylesterase [Mesonia sp.]
MNKFKIKLVCALAFLGFAFCASAQESKLKFADPLSDHMVIQQNKAFKVWGKSEPNSEVTITADWALPIKVFTDKNGDFEGIISVPKAKPGDYTQHSIKIASGTKEAIINDILIGEVWLCSGQSNMQFSLEEEINAEKELPNANNPNIRLFNTQLNFSDLPINSVSGEWKVCTPETAKKFSAVGYYFGKKIYQELNVPIGLVFTGIGASAAQAYVPKEVLAEDDLLNETYLKPYLISDKSKEKIDGGFSFEKVTRPYLLYNAMIHPFKNLSIKGVIWYQGEANRGDREAYTEAMFKMITAWRRVFSQGDFPFYYVQIAPYDYDKKAPEYTEDAYFREAQQKISKLGNTKMVSTLDVGNKEDLHPKNKKPIGQRLAKTALNQTYNFLEIPFTGPAIDYIEFKKKKAVVHYIPTSIASGLETNDGESPKFFQLAGEDGKFYWAKALIVDNAIEVFTKQVKSPKYLRYAFTNYPITNLQNGEGIPAVQFRSDNFKE